MQWQAGAFTLVVRDIPQANVIIRIYPDAVCHAKLIPLGMDENAARMLMLQSILEQLWATILASGRDRSTAMEAVERIAHAGRDHLEGAPAGPSQLRYQIAAMQDEFWAGVRLKVGEMVDGQD